MAIDRRLKVYEAISGSTIHQSISSAASQAAISRCQANHVKDPTSAMEILRSLIQPEINIRIQKVLSDVAESHLKPAVRNLRLNLGEENVPATVLEDVCVSALEAAKDVYRHKSQPTTVNIAVNNNNNNMTSYDILGKQRTPQPPSLPPMQQQQQQPPLPPPQLTNISIGGGNSCVGNNNIMNSSCTVVRAKCPNQVLKRSFSGSSHHSSPTPKKSMIIKSGLGRPNTDLILVNKAGRPVRREGPKWEPERLTSETLFILGSRANKALGFGQTRGRLYIKHPELFKYSGDQNDKEWLAKANLMATTGGKAYLMVLQDILDLAESPEYSSHPKQQPSELVGFTVPDWMLEKMKAYIETAKTNPETTDEELLRIAEEYAEMEEEGKKIIVKREDLVGGQPPTTTTTVSIVSAPLATSSSVVQQLDDEIRKKLLVADVTAPAAAAQLTLGGAGTSLGLVKKEEDDEDMSLEGLMCGADGDAAASNVAQLFNDIKHEAMDDDLQNLDPGFLQGMNLHNLVREFEMDTGNGSELNLLALADDSLQ